MGKPTLKIVAERAGVSVSAASLALRGQGQLSPKTVARIREAAEELGYLPNPVVASLASRRFRQNRQFEGTPVVVLDCAGFSQRRPHVSQYAETLRQTASELGYVASILMESEVERYRDLPKVLFSRGVQGVVVTGEPNPDLFTDHDLWSKFSLVQCGRFRRASPLHMVRSNVFQSVMLSFEKAIEYGYHRIALGLGMHRPVLEDDESRLAAVEALMGLYPERLVSPYLGQIGDHQAVVDWVRALEPDVVVGFTHCEAKALSEAGFAIPGELGFLALHLPEQKATTVSGLNQQRQEIARQSVFLLDQLIRHNDRGIPEKPFQLLIPSVWVEGETLLKRNCLTAPASELLGVGAGRW